MSELTPLMKQYAQIKEQHRDAILFFRLGDFYEMFGEDAEKASKVLQIALTTRDKTKENPVPMCGVPYFASDSYISKLVRAGHRVAICEQMEDPRDAKGIVTREVVRVITPGTHAPENPKENSYLISISPAGKRHGIAAADISTGQFLIYETEENIEDEVSRFEPREILLPNSVIDSLHYREVLSGLYLTGVEDWNYDHQDAYRVLLNHFKVSSLDGYGCEGMTAAISAAGALIAYIAATQREAPPFRKITTMVQTANLFMDAATQRNLELTQILRDGSRQGSLLWVMDETLTPMGGRFMRASILRPLTDLREIRARHEAVAFLLEDFELLEALRSLLRKVQDLERLSARVSAGTANARDLVAIRTSLAQMPKMKRALLSSGDPSLQRYADSISDLSALQDLLERSIIDNPPLGVRDGGMIRDQFNGEVDNLRSVSTRGKDFIAEMEARERKRTGIASLKIGFNKVFGYYIEITKPNLDLVPENYSRKQTLVGCERFITQELKEYEDTVLGSEERLKNLEYEVFRQVLDSVRDASPYLQRMANVIAVVDFLVSLAVIAKRYNYVRPEMTDDTVIEITDGRHPVLERLLAASRFIPNSTTVDADENRVIILTGPNMAGKSTYMRQVALIALMAQTGSFVPALSAKIGWTDRIFTRIGASDALTRGQSTFMVEMIEVANIVHNATPRSLIVLDEVGRGTSTFDGISIAWAIAEHILNRIRARTLFATHYNELTELALTHDGVRNYNIAVREWGDEIIFLRKIEEGPADKSYGIQVARLAGIPDAIVGRAKEVLHNLEKEELNEAGKPKFAAKRTRRRRREQLDLFATGNEAVLRELAALDPSAVTAEQALEKLRDFRARIVSS